MVKAGSQAVSDHIPVIGTLDFQALGQKASDLSRGRLKPGPSWVKPPEFARHEWTDLLSASWANLEQTEDVRGYLARLQQTEIDVETEWAGFVQVLDSLFRSTFTKLAETSRNEETRTHSTKVLRSCSW